MNECMSLVRDFIIKTIQDVVTAHCPNRNLTQDQVDAVIKELLQLTGLQQHDFDNAGLDTKNVEQFETDLCNLIT